MNTHHNQNSPSADCSGTSPVTPEPLSQVQRYLDGVRISMFNSVRDHAPAADISVLDLLRGIRSGRWKSEIDEVRRILSDHGVDEYNTAKRMLPAVSISCIIDGNRKDADGEGRIKTSGLIQIDIDAKDNAGLAPAEMAHRCRSTGFCLAIFTSPSGTGVKALVVANSAAGSHRACCASAWLAFRNAGLVVDELNDVGRLMFVSHDPDLWMADSIPAFVEPTHHTDTPGSSPETDSGGDSEFDEAEVAEMLSHIVARPEYNTWRDISFIVIDHLGLETGLKVLKNWSPEEVEEEYRAFHRPNYSGRKVGIGTLIRMAAANGYEAPPKIPEHIIPVPSGGISHSQSSRKIFKMAALRGGFFNRGGAMVTIEGDEQNGPVAATVSAERFVEIVESLGGRVARRERERVGGPGTDDTRVRVKWRTCAFPVSAAKVALASCEIQKHLPPLRQILHAPVIVGEGDRECRILESGYYRDQGGTFISSGGKIASTGDQPVASLLVRRMLVDFDFVTPSDLSRALACLITPALKTGGLLMGDTPIFVTEARESQSGKSYFHRMVATLYNEIPSVVTCRSGGVGSLDESVSTALLNGRIFICIDNCRGSLDSPVMESAIRGQGRVMARGFRSIGNVDTRAFIWLLSTNGARLTRDLANRSSIIRIRKRPRGYVFRAFEEGDLLQGIAARRAAYLGAIFDIIRKWRSLGMPRTNDVGHDFHEWAGSLDWIIQNLLGCAPLLDGHRGEQARQADPSLQWLREVITNLSPEQWGRSLRAADLVGVMSRAGIDFPGGPNQENQNTHCGRIMNQIFESSGSDTVVVDGVTVMRCERVEQRRGEARSSKLYQFTPQGGTTSPPAPPVHSIS